MECFIFLLRCRQLERTAGAVHVKRDRRQTGERFLERQPPEITAAIGKIGGNIDRERYVVTLEHRIRIVTIIPVAIIKREHCERRRRVAGLQPLGDIIHPDDIKTIGANLLNDAFEKFRRDL